METSDYCSFQWWEFNDAEEETTTAEAPTVTSETTEQDPRSTATEQDLFPTSTEKADITTHLTSVSSKQDLPPTATEKAHKTIHGTSASSMKGLPPASTTPTPSILPATVEKGLIEDVDGDDDYDNDILDISEDELIMVTNTSLESDVKREQDEFEWWKIDLYTYYLIGKLACSYFMRTHVKLPMMILVNVSIIDHLMHIILALTLLHLSVNEGHFFKMSDEINEKWFIYRG